MRRKYPLLLCCDKSWKQDCCLELPAKFSTTKSPPEVQSDPRLVKSSDGQHKS
jgi:hypothetical protein